MTQATEKTEAVPKPANRNSTTYKVLVVDLQRQAAFLERRCALCATELVTRDTVALFGGDTTPAQYALAVKTMHGEHAADIVRIEPDSDRVAAIVALIPEIPVEQIGPAATILDAG